MAIEKLSARFVATVSRPGDFADGGGLYLQIARAADGGVTKSWFFRYQNQRALAHGKRRSRYHGLGSLVDVSLAEARRRARECRLQVKVGIDPIDAKAAAREQRFLELRQDITFREAAEACMADKREGWRSGVHAKQWAQSLRDYVYPVIGDLSVKAITRQHVKAVVSPIWTDKNETAKRVRARIERVMAWAAANEHCNGSNPAAWRGALDELMPKIARRVEHFAALPHREVGALMQRLRALDGNKVARAIKFMVLCAGRPGEVMQATWREIDLDTAVWAIPPERMKGNRLHEVPLARAALALLRPLRKGVKENDLVFGRIGRSEFGHLLKRHLNTPATPHGFRSSFADFVRECTNTEPEIRELCLAHQVGDATMRAYSRSQLLEKRRIVMEQWASYLDRPVQATDKAGKVVAIGKHRL